MGAIRALLVEVSEYFDIKYECLPWCINDLSAMKDALVRGLNVSTNNIFLCGENGTVTRKNLLHQ